MCFVYVKKRNSRLLLKCFECSRRLFAEEAQRWALRGEKDSAKWHRIVPDDDTKSSFTNEIIDCNESINKPKTVFQCSTTILAFVLLVVGRCCRRKNHFHAFIAPKDEVNRCQRPAKRLNFLFFNWICGSRYRSKAAALFRQRNGAFDLENDSAEQNLCSPALFVFLLLRSWLWHEMKENRWDVGVMIPTHSTFIKPGDGERMAKSRFPCFLNAVEARLWVIVRVLNMTRGASSFNPHPNSRYRFQPLQTSSWVKRKQSTSNTHENLFYAMRERVKCSIRNDLCLNGARNASRHYPPNAHTQSMSLVKLLRLSAFEIARRPSEGIFNSWQKRCLPSCGARWLTGEWWGLKVGRRGVLINFEVKGKFCIKFESSSG